MKDTIRDILATMDGVEITEEQKEEIEDEIYFTEEWRAVMGKIEEMIHEVKK